MMELVGGVEVKTMKTLKFATILVVMVATVAIAGGAVMAEGSIVNFTGKIVKVTGAVYVQKAGEADWVEAEHGMEVGAQDVITTGPESSADILFVREDTRSKIRILEEADMSLATLDLNKVTGDSEILLDLAIGHIIIKTDPLKGKSKFRVLTPTSMTAVRGTGFEVKVVRESPVADEDAIQ